MRLSLHFRCTANHFGLISGQTCVQANLIEKIALKPDSGRFQLKDFYRDAVQSGIHRGDLQEDLKSYSPGSHVEVAEEEQEHILRIEPVNIYFSFLLLIPVGDRVFWEPMRLLLENRSMEYYYGYTSFEEIVGSGSA